MKMFLINMLQYVEWHTQPVALKKSTPAQRSVAQPYPTPTFSTFSPAILSCAPLKFALHVVEEALRLYCSSFKSTGKISMFHKHNKTAAFK